MEEINLENIKIRLCDGIIKRGRFIDLGFDGDFYVSKLVVGDEKRFSYSKYDNTTERLQHDYRIFKLFGFDMIDIARELQGEKRMLTDYALEQKLAGSPAERVTKEQMQARITETKFHRLGLTLTHCTIHLDNGYQVTGESACVNVANYNQEIGERIAYDNAFNKLWSLFGFLLAEKNFLAARTK